MIARSTAGVLVAALLAGSVAAQDAAQDTAQDAAQDTAETIQARLELPAHRALLRMIRAETPGLAPFETDGCSGGLSSAWTLFADWFPEFATAHGGVPPWQACCVVHDRAYHAGGTQGDARDSFAARLDADRALRTCVIDTGEDRIDDLLAIYGTDADTVRQAYRTIGQAMFLAVRLGGGPCSGLPWRWGYGLPHCIITPADL
jgi:hypothetical protein